MVLPLGAFNESIAYNQTYHPSRTAIAANHRIARRLRVFVHQGSNPGWFSRMELSMNRSHTTQPTTLPELIMRSQTMHCFLATASTTAWIRLIVHHGSYPGRFTLKEPSSSRRSALSWIVVLCHTARTDIVEVSFCQLPYRLGSSLCSPTGLSRAVPP